MLYFNSFKYSKILYILKEGAVLETDTLFLMYILLSKQILHLVDSPSIFYSYHLQIFVKSPNLIFNRTSSKGEITLSLNLSFLGINNLYSNR
jgi:hypothetical protein